MATPLRYDEETIMNYFTDYMQFHNACMGGNITAFKKELYRAYEEYINEAPEELIHETVDTPVGLIPEYLEDFLLDIYEQVIGDGNPEQMSDTAIVSKQSRNC